MKVCFTTFACPTWTLPEIIEAATKHAYHGIEFRCDAGHSHGAEIYSSDVERNILQTKVDKAGLEVVCLASSLQFVYTGVMEEARERFQLAAEIGARAIRVFAGPMPETMKTTAEVVERVAENLHEALDLAEQLDIEIWLETHDSLSEGAAAAAVCRRVANPRLGVSYNNVHPVRKGEPLETTMAALHGLIRHIHFHDGLNLPDQVIIKRLGQGQMPIEETMEALARTGYDGYLSGEWFYDQLGAQPEDALDAYMYDIRQITHRHGVALGLGF